MARLIIDLLEPEMGTGEDGDPFAVSITHLRVCEQPVGPAGLRLESSPGILLITPSRGGIRVRSQLDAFDVPRDMVFVVSGRERKEVFAVSGGLRDGRDPRLQVIELNARINGDVDLGDAISPPFLLDYESSELVLGFLHRQGMLSAPIMLGAGSANVSRRFMAAELLGCVLRSAGATPAGLKQTTGDDRTRTLKIFLRSHLARKISTKEMAAHLGMSRSGFGSWSRKHLECPPALFLKELRLDQAQEWLAQGMRNIAQVAEKSGFSDRFSFSKAFKQRFGMPPAQYARARGGAPKSDFLVRAANLYHRHRFRRALAICEEGLQAAVGEPRDRLRYQRSLCLLSLGETTKAMAEWRALERSTCAHEAGVRLCRHLFNAGQYGEACERFEKLYSAADTTQQERLVPLWIDQVLQLRTERRAPPLHRYLALCSERFPGDRRAVGVAVDCWRDLGENEQVYRHFTDYPQFCFFAMRRAGKPDEAHARFGHALPKRKVAMTLRHFGRYEEMLACESVRPRFRAEALTELGRPEEAIRLYPDDCMSAYLALRRYEELLERFPGPGPEHVYALHALNRFGELKRFRDFEPDPWLWFIIQEYACPHAILEANHPDARVYAANARLLKAFACLQEGDRPTTEVILARIAGVRSPDLWWGDHNSTEFLLASLTRAFLGDRQGLDDDLETSITLHKLKDEQILWHDAGYLVGKISATAYKAQPQRRRMAHRFPFIQAVKHDINDHRSRALAAYKDFLATTQPYPDLNLLRHRFAEWRLKELGPGSL